LLLPKKQAGPMWFCVGAYDTQKLGLVENLPAKKE
jgi:hypothetical protein